MTTILRKSISDQPSIVLSNRKRVMILRVREFVLKRLLITLDYRLPVSQSVTHEGIASSASGGSVQRAGRGRPPKITNIKLNPARGYNNKPAKEHQTDEYRAKREKNNDSVRRTRANQKQEAKEQRERIIYLEKKVDTLEKRNKVLEAGRCSKCAMMNGLNYDCE